MSVDSYYYDVAQICENGDLITSRANNEPVKCSPYCPICAAKTIKACPECKTPIRGSYARNVYRSSSNLSAPKMSTYYYGVYKIPCYCHNCGAPYPWTTKRINEFNSVVDMTAGVTTDEKEDLKSSFPHVLADNAQTVSSSLKIRNKLDKISSSAAGPLKEILTKVATAGALKFLGL